MTEEHFHELLEEYTDGTIDEDGSRELKEAFASDPDLKQRFVGELRVANSLHGLPSLESADQLTDHVLESIRLAKDSPDVSSAVLTELRGEKKVVSFPFMRLGLAIAAAVAVLFAVLNLRPQVEALATLANATDVRWADNQDFSENDALSAGLLRLEAGVARIDFETGVRVTLEGPAHLELLSKTEVRLHSGNLAAHVPPTGVGFQVYTEKVDVTDLGTTFGVSVAKDGSTDVEVFEGKVEVAPPDGDASGIVQREIILEGDAINVPGDAGKPTRRRLKSRSFRGWPVLFGVVNTGGQIRFVNAQPIRNPSEVTDNENVVVFPERFHALTKQVLTASFTSAGDYAHADLKDRNESVDLIGRPVHSYLLQFNPPFAPADRKSEQTPFAGEIRFDRPIVAVITDRELLRESDVILGKRRFTYPTNQSRGLEHGDSLSLSPDRHTLHINWLVMQSLKNGMDQIRVIVEAAPKAIASR
jgi:hypothetical protein